MQRTKKTIDYLKKAFPEGYGLETLDPELAERFENFAFDETVSMDDHTRMLAILAALMGCQGLEEFQVTAPAALRLGVTAIELKEIIYQAVAYLGMGRVRPFLRAANDLLAAQAVPLPLAPQAKTTLQDRLAAGNQAQVEIFGEGMRDFWRSGPEDSRIINRFLAENCFGDYYTRGGLDLKQREMITFCLLAAQGGCEPQLKSHAAANMRMGNDKGYLISILVQCLPYIGDPRTLNALACVRAAAEGQA